MSVKWTDEQLLAIEEKDKTLLVSAAAGSGKTAVLVERIIRKITDEQNPSNIDDFLIVTFTNAAALEMKQKISEAIYKKLIDRPRDKHLQSQLARIGRANIDTVHGFCFNLIKKHFDKLGLPTNFKIADENETAIIFDEVLLNVVENWYEKSGEDSIFLKTVEQFSGTKNDKGFIDILKKIWWSIISQPYPLKSLKKYADDLSSYSSMDPLLTPHGKIIKDYILDSLTNAAELSRSLCEKLPQEGEVFKDLLYSDNRKITELINIVKNTNSYDIVADYIKNFKFDRFPTKKCEKDIKEFIKNEREKYRTVNKDILSFFDTLKVDIQADYTQMQEYAHLIYEVLSDFSKAFAQEKINRGLIDFNDIEHFALRLLVKNYVNDNTYEKSDIAKELSLQFKEIYVDEYQDTNVIQDLIFRALSRDEKNIFMVGDIKQSIYRFREACPDIFTKKKDSFKEVDKKDPNAAKVILSKNFRSRESIIDGINYIFKTIMSKKLGEIDYDSGEALAFGAEYYDKKYDAPIEADILISNLNTEGSEEDLDVNLFKIECKHIASRINEIINNKTPVMDKQSGNIRPAGYRDIVILLRNLKNRGEVLEQILNEEGIPTYSDTESVFFGREEISIILSLLQVIDNPLQDTHLISVMRSPIFGFTPDELAEIRLCKTAVPFYEAVEEMSRTSVKCKTFIDKLEEYRICSKNMSIDKLLYYIYEDTSFMSIVGAMTNGALRQANLQLLYDYARKYEETEFKGIFNFNNYIERIKQADKDIPSVKAFSENSDVVKIMTHHKSKGLEFPIVIVADLSHGFNLMDLNGKLLTDKQLGIAFRLKDIDRMIEYDTFARKAIKIKKMYENLSEELRILYVALTRAKERLYLIISAGNKKFCKDAPMYDNAISPYYLLKAKTPANWLLAALQHHKNAEKLCKTFNIPFKWIDDKSEFNINLIDSVQINSDLEETEELPSENIKVDEGILKAIKDRLDFVYPFEKETQTATKLTVTKIKKLIEINDEGIETSTVPKYRPVLFNKPRFVEEQNTLTSAEKGTALHTVMQFIDFSKTNSIAEIKDELDRLEENYFITKAQREAVEPAVINSLFESDFGKRLKNSKKIQREKRFSILISAAKLKELTGEDIAEPIDENLILQGVIDCIFEENDSLVLVDFKTDKCKENEIIDRYKVQIKLYNYAIKEITGKYPYKSYIYSFYLQKEIEIKE